MKTGDIVQFKECLYSDEMGARYKVVEINGDRVIVEFLCDLPIPPQSVALISELEVIGESEVKVKPAG